MIDRHTEDEYQNPSREGFLKQDEPAEQQRTDSEPDPRVTAKNTDLTDLYSDLFQKKKSAVDAQKSPAGGEFPHAVNSLKTLKYDGKPIPAPLTLVCL
jgi:hypothetical protein